MAELFTDRRAHFLGCSTRCFLNEFPCWVLEAESGRSGAELDATLALLLDSGLLSRDEDESVYTVDEYHELYRPVEQLFDALLDQAPVLCELFAPTELE